MRLRGRRIPAGRFRDDSRRPQGDPRWQTEEGRPEGVAPWLESAEKGPPCRRRHWPAGVPLTQRAMRLGLQAGEDVEDPNFTSGIGGKIPHSGEGPPFPFGRLGDPQTPIDFPGTGMPYFPGDDDVPAALSLLLETAVWLVTCGLLVWSAPLVVGATRRPRRARDL